MRGIEFAYSPRVPKQPVDDGIITTNYVCEGIYHEGTFWICWASSRVGARMSAWHSLSLVSIRWRHLLRGNEWEKIQTRRTSEVCCTPDGKCGSFPSSRLSLSNRNHTQILIDILKSWLNPLLHSYFCRTCAMVSRPLINGKVPRCWIADGFSKPYAKIPRNNSSRRSISSKVSQTCQIKFMIKNLWLLNSNSLLSVT